MNQHTFLFELGVEELPPGYITTFIIPPEKEKYSLFQQNLMEQLQQAKCDVNTSAITSFCTPRRLGIKILFNSALQAFEAEEIKKVGPIVKTLEDKSAVGFARGCGIEPSQLQQDEDGRIYCMIRVEPKPIKDLLSEIIKRTFEQFNKTVGMRFMHWGNGTDVFIRPVKWITCMFNDEIIPMQWYGLEASNTTRGHRFHSGQIFAIDHAKNYESLLEKHFVEADFNKRRKRIWDALSIIGRDKNARPVQNDALLNEVTAINEWPHAILCEFDASFLSVPQEALIQAMQSHQKSFPLLDTEGKLLPSFVTISNIEVSDYVSIKHGNEKVMTARLSDAKFFFDTDLKHSFDEMNQKCKQVTFQKKLGSQWDKTRRVVMLAEFIARTVGAEVDSVKRAAELANADLNSQMVFEFPELQGIMGKYYAKAAGENNRVADCIEQRYWPRSSDDGLPASLEAQSLALADRIDTLMGIFGIGQKPSGSKDPYSLRRAAIGLVRIIRANKLELSLAELLNFSQQTFPDGIVQVDALNEVKTFILKRLEDIYSEAHPEESKTLNILRAVLACQDDNLADIDVRFDALINFKDSAEMSTLGEANKRCKNLLRKASEDGHHHLPDFDISLAEDSELPLVHALDKLNQVLSANSDYHETLKAMTILAAPLSDYFENVMVMCEDSKIRFNRLSLLKRISELFHRVADISYL